ncbi:hypothetical protein [Amycolatopsis keratiniphila]|uniref:Uncharacterized protein n=1 Tax=Amycolatopsis keratiniphila subsp. keratiniphila TaxID=227715 RepID=A0A1W2LVW0_9PSEU|nr:hypothetical protein [Amycolatopsis keratiniphila]OLZ58073.1 hypothetical protein BS330_12605 [Amycolatopsis keratiniphila subsp. nogabecina]ONF70415.1 hypothetical protein AVR91_0216455 [Amycolatopsis keratiniphila subsp. keratiniphila]SDU43832.1 hypothetical protein SAMN04489733_4257 [Amycolatopsis keratiniphila]
MIGYLGSTKNLAGCVGGLIGLALYLTGVVGGLWPLVVAGLYAVFALLAPPERVRLVSPDAVAEAGQLRADLESLVGKVTERAQRMPGSSVDSVRRIAEVLEDLLSRPERWAANPDVQHAVTRLARTDLPLSVETYLNLPWWFAAKRPADELLAQLELLETEAHRIAERFYAGDVHQQADHTRYLRERGESA